jgi:hypothetical protein
MNSYAKTQGRGVIVNHILLPAEFLSTLTVFRACPSEGRLARPKAGLPVCRRTSAAKHSGWSTPFSHSSESTLGVR